MASDEARDPVEEAAEIFSHTADQVVTEETVKQILQKAIPVITLFKYLRSNGVSRKTAEEMILSVWRNWFEHGEYDGWILDRIEGDD